MVVLLLLLFLFSTKVKLNQKCGSVIHVLGSGKKQPYQSRVRLELKGQYITSDKIGNF